MYSLIRRTIFSIVLISVGVPLCSSLLGSATDNWSNTEVHNCESANTPQVGVVSSDGSTRINYWCVLEISFCAISVIFLCLTSSSHTQSLSSRGDDAGVVLLHSPPRLIWMVLLTPSAEPMRDLFVCGGQVRQESVTGILGTPVISIRYHPAH